MRFNVAASALFLVPCALALVAPSPHLQNKRSTVLKEGVEYNVFEHAATGAKLEYVNNSGICETTPGVNQYSGYLSVGENMNMWFWFFEARQNASTAPLAAWFNGGPGCSSMIGLFQENGPCHFVNGSTEPSLNEYSFNEYANVIYIDQPIGVGFSYGDDQVTSTYTAAPYVWKLLQAFFDQFPQYESRDFAIFTESYGGHYGPEFASYILDQNKGVANGSVTGDAINLVALGINNGWIDAGIQEKAYIDFAVNNTYKQILSSSDAQSYYSAYNDECLPAVKQCESSGTNNACINADNVCYDSIEGPISGAADFNVYDVRLSANAVDPPETYVDYLARSDVKKAIGAKSNYSECPDAAYYKFSSTGDNPRSFVSELEAVIQAGISTIVWAGDADWICNWVGNYDVAQTLDFSGASTYRNASLEPYTVDGVEKGTFKTVDNFSFLRVYEAGHEVPYYQPEAALQVFKQLISQGKISSTSAVSGASVVRSVLG
ncbi:putative carboxypeptidase S1 [Phyllosticta citribraziliensis]|uniref:Carboxypeptidase n=1 Tax=Phyllosticta citribraziliensis TaxID=989973 RepID=A0ABR1L673_9PEZI